MNNNNNNIEFKLLERKSDLEDVVQECSAYLKTKQFMADRIYQQQEEIQILKQQIFSLSSTNSQLGRFIENFEKETIFLKEKLGKKELKSVFNACAAKENTNPNCFKATNSFLKLVSKGNCKNADAAANEAENNFNNLNNFNAAANNKFNLSDDDPLMKSVVLQSAFEENKDNSNSFSEFEQMNYNLIETSQNSEDCNNCIINNNDFIENKKNENFENGSQAENKINENDLEFIGNDNFQINKNKNKFENLKISERHEIQENFNPNNKKKIMNNINCNLNKNLNCNNNNNICNNNFTCINNTNNNLNLSFYNYNFQINNEKNIADEKLQKLNNEIIEKTIENNKLRTDKFIIMSELNEILTSLTRIDLDKLNDFYLNNISKNNLSKYLMPTAKGIKFNILSCQNNLAKIIKSDFIKKTELEDLYPKNFVENFNNNDMHFNKNYLSSNYGVNNNQYYSSNFNPNNFISPVQNPRKLSNNEENLFSGNNNNFNNNYNNSFNCKNNQNNDNSDNLANYNKRKIKNVLEKNFNVNVNGLNELFSKHEGEFEALLEKKLMKLNRNNVKNCNNNPIPYDNINFSNNLNNYNNCNNNKD